MISPKHGNSALLFGPEYAIIVTDREGDNLVFDTLSEAEGEANDCQVGIL